MIRRTIVLFFLAGCAHETAIVKPPVEPPRPDDTIELVDWDGQIANPYVEVAVPAPGASAVVVRANGSRLYFDLPSYVGPDGPSKALAPIDGVARFKMGIFPDRAGGDEDYTLTIDVDGTVSERAIHVRDLDVGMPLVMSVTLDFSHDKTGFCDDPHVRSIVSEAAKDWAYFIDDMKLDEVPKGDEPSWIWDPVGSFITGRIVTNPAAYTGFLLYVYGIHGEQLRSGGSGSHGNIRQRSRGLGLELARSGTFEIETAGNYSTNGWFFTTGDEDWAHSGNLREEPADFASIAHHEIGHALARSIPWPAHLRAKSGRGLTSPALDAYLGGPLKIDTSDHFGGVIDPASGFGAFGNEYGGIMPLKRWLITKTDLLALAATGWRVRNVPDDQNVSKRASSAQMASR